MTREAYAMNLPLAAITDRHECSAVVVCWGVVIRVVNVLAGWPCCLLRERYMDDTYNTSKYHIPTVSFSCSSRTHIQQTHSHTVCPIPVSTEIHSIHSSIHPCLSHIILLIHRDPYPLIFASLKVRAARAKKKERYERIDESLEDSPSMCL